MSLDDDPVAGSTAFVVPAAVHISLICNLSFRNYTHRFDLFTIYIYIYIKPLVSGIVVRPGVLNIRKRDFFEKHGFVLLQKKTAMTAQDWMQCAPKTLDLSNFTGAGPRWVMVNLREIILK